MTQKGYVENAVKFNRLLVILLVIIAIIVAVNAGEKTEVDIKMTGVTLQMDQPGSAKVTEIELKGSIKKMFLRNPRYRGEVIINGDVFQCKAVVKGDPESALVTKIENGNTYTYGQLYYNAQMTEVTLVLNGFNPKTGSIIVAPAISPEDALDIAETLMDKTLIDESLRGTF